MADSEYNLLSDQLTLTAAQQAGDLDNDDSQNLHNSTFFVDAMNHNYNEIAEFFGSGCEMSHSRLIDAYGYWQEDAKRTLERGIDEGSPTLDHFKHASFIAFWLRRTMPVNRIVGTKPVPRVSRPNTDLFNQFGNEICALHIGFQLCLFYESTKWKSNANNVDIRAITMKRLSFPATLLEEFAKILKHKNMSPYALYLMYKSLFNNTLPSG